MAEALHDGEQVVSEYEKNGVAEGFQVGTREIGGRVAIRTGLGASMSTLATLTVAAARKHARQVTEVAAGIQGRKALELATAAGKAEDFADLVTGVFPFPEKAPKAEAMSDREWAHLDHILAHATGFYGLLNEYWKAAGRALDGEVSPWDDPCLHCGQPMGAHRPGRADGGYLCPVPSDPEPLYPDPSVVGRIVAPLSSDTDDLTGRVTSQLDEDRVEVAWADEQYSETPATSTVFIDDLRPVR